MCYFLPLFLLGLFFIDKKYKNGYILIASILFYSWGAPKFIFVIIFTTFIDFILVKQIHTSENAWRRKLYLTVSVGLNLGLLFYFKYSNFFIENVNVVLGVFSTGKIEWTKLILPIGISFYTFETITYVVDVYRKVHKPLTNFWDYLLYILLFPKLIAGPIIRYHQLADQIKERNESDENRLTGLYRFIFGLAKKVLIANQMAVVADAVFAIPASELGTATAWMGSLAYTFQIYFDFSGYSDMAIGLGKIMGFKFPENFNNPYVSESITEFWRRWHITLGSWMKNYLYIPLGGNKVKNLRLYFNLWIVFLVSGLWHGAAWNFIIWGAYHGFFLVTEKLFLAKWLHRIGKLPSVLFTFFIVNIGWVLFRADNFKSATLFIQKMFSFKEFVLVNSIDVEFMMYFVVAIVFSFFAIAKFGLAIQDRIYFKEYSNKRHALMTIICIALFILSVSSITSSGLNPFIYFRF